MNERQRLRETVTAFTMRRIRNEIIEECIKAARDGFEDSMKDYVLIGPGGLAMQIINSVKALKDED